MAVIICSESHKCRSAAGSCRHLNPQQITKYMPMYYKHATGQTRGDDDTELEDKLQALQQQTLTMHTEWQKEQAAAHACELPALCSAHPQLCNACTP